MSKESEALDKLWFHAKYDLKQNNNLYFEYLDIYKGLKKALTPPTADEVCKALSEWFGKKVIYIADVKKFAYEGIDGWQEICYFGKNLKGDVIKFSFKLPPHLITLIGRFYEGESK